MKTPRRSHSTRTASDPRENAKQIYAQALRACEAVAVRVRAASEELAASWTALCLEISAGASATDLLRKRAWCNVLELRLKEQAYALEQARHAVDSVWDELMLAARAREVFNGLLRQNAAEASADPNGLPLLARNASATAAAQRRIASAKK